MAFSIMHLLLIICMPNYAKAFNGKSGKFVIIPRRVLGEPSFPYSDAHEIQSDSTGISILYTQTYQE